MAKGGFLALVDDKLSEAFAYVAPDFTKVRATFLRGLAKVESTFNEGKQSNNPQSQWSANNNVVRFTPKMMSAPVKLHGKDEFHIPSERFLNALAELRKEVEAGEHDTVLHEAESGAMKASAGRGSDARMQQAGSVRAGWSPERRAKYEATQAAKKGGKPA